MSGSPWYTLPGSPSLQVDLDSERLGLPGMLPGVCESAELEGITEWVSLQVRREHTGVVRREI